MKSSANYVKCEEPGCGIGCGTIVGLTMFITFIGVISFVDSEQAIKNTNMKPKKETVNSIDTCTRIKDSICVYKAR